jgi:hypothetical protein
MATELKITTCRLDPHVATDSEEIKKQFSTIWLRKSVCSIVSPVKRTIIEAGGDPSLFYNHVPENGKTRIGYPLIIYHYIDGTFFLTGINDGAITLASLARMRDQPFPMAGILFDKFHFTFPPLSAMSVEITPGTTSYKLCSWLPLHHTDAKKYRSLPLDRKVAVLNEHLGKHVVQEFGKYLEIPLNGIVVGITDITGVLPDVLYKGYAYPALDIEFSANAILPAGLTLGNNKALGYGRIELP